MSTTGKFIAIGAVIGLAFGGLLGSALLGMHGGVAGSVIGILVGGSTLGVLGRAASQVEEK